MAFGGYVSVYLSHFVNIVKKIQEEEEKGKERMVMSLDAANLFSHKESRPGMFF